MNVADRLCELQIPFQRRRMQDPIIERVDYHGWMLRRGSLGGFWYVSRCPYRNIIFVSAELEDAKQTWSHLVGQTITLEACPTQSAVPDAWWILTKRNLPHKRLGKWFPNFN